VPSSVFLFGTLKGKQKWHHFLSRKDLHTLVQAPVHTCMKTFSDDKTDAIFATSSATPLSAPDSSILDNEGSNGNFPIGKTRVNKDNGLLGTVRKTPLPFSFQ
jgi:hypothetical protein